MAVPGSHYSHMASDMKGVIFLGTPHRGTKLASILHKVLSITLNKKICIEQIGQYCSTVERIFDEFDQLKIRENSVSFYESMGMSLFNHVVHIPNAL